VTWLAQSYHLLATLLFVLASAVVSVRLMLLARRTGEKPELLLGLGIFGTAVLGYGVLIAAGIARGVGSTVCTTPLERGLQAAGELLHDAGVSMVVLFVVTVFRAGQRWAAALAGAMIGALWAGAIGWELQNGYRSAAVGNAFWWVRYAVIWTYPLWTSIESYRYYGLMRRRVALGLADPLVANRFLVWGSASLGTALATWTASAPYFLMSDPARAVVWMPPIQIATASIGVVTVGLYALTFFPPAAYRRWVAGELRPAR
jgi:hypothetical protein